MPKRLFDGGALQQAIRVAPQQVPDMIGRKTSVDLVPTFLLPEHCIPDIHFSSLRSPVFTFKLSTF